VPSHAHVERPFREVWYRLLEGLAEGRFDLETADIGSGVIQASFTFDSGEGYVDCGRSRRTFERDGAVEEFDYAISGDSAYRSGRNRDECADTQEIVRDTTLEGRIDVRVTPDGEGTAVGIHIDYALTAVASGEYEILCPGVALTGPTDTHTGEVRLGTDEPGEVDWGAHGSSLFVVCGSTGRLEREILAFSQ